MPTEGNFDWLAATYPVDTPTTRLFPGCIGQLPLKDEGNPAHGYRIRQVNEVGCIVYSGGSESQGIHTVITGEAFSDFRDRGVTDCETAAHCRDYYGRATRVDVAVDLYETKVTRDQLVRLYRKGKCVTKARSGRVTKDLNTPEGTFYLGTRASQRFFRAYDKGAQMKDPRAWLRLELECKKLQAQAVLQALASQPNTRSVINRAIKDYVYFPGVPDFVSALADDDAVIPHVPRKMTNTLRWLLEQVAPALARYEVEHPEELVRQSFLTAWRIALESLALTGPMTHDELQAWDRLGDATYGSNFDEL